MNNSCSAFRGALVISLDFELHWGLVDTFSLESIQDRLLGTRTAIPAILELFEEFEIHATWATVGLLFHHTRDALLAGLPNRRPAAAGDKLSPYDMLSVLGSDEQADPYHYASSIIDRIAAVPHQEIASHSFAHHIWDRTPEDIEAFRADLTTALATARSKGINISCYVFPQNKYGSDLIGVLEQEGMLAFRGDGRPWYWLFDREHKVSQTLFRCLRLLDRHVNLSGGNAYRLESLGQKPPYNIPGGLGLEYFSHAPWLSAFEPLRLRRLTTGLTKAALQQKIFHLWCHPHQFGEGMREKLDFLRRFLSHFADLREKRELESLNMKEVADRWALHNSKNTQAATG